MILTCTESWELWGWGDTKIEGGNLTLCCWQAIWGHPQCRTATCLWEGFWDRLCWIPHPACSSWGCKPKVHRAGSRNQESSARNSRTQGKDWTQACFPALLAINSLLTAHKPVCSVTKVTSLFWEKNYSVSFGTMRRKLFPSLKRPGAFSRLNLVLAFSLFQVLEEKIVQEYKKFRKVRIGLGVVAGRVKMDFFFFWHGCFFSSAVPRL